MELFLPKQTPRLLGLLFVDFEDRRQNSNWRKIQSIGLFLFFFDF